MARVNIRENNPSLYAKIRAEQEALRKELGGSVMMARLCPFCQHKVEMLCRGTHGPTVVKCANCGEEVMFPPVSFRSA